MKVIRIIVGILLILTGIVWFLQGINLLAGSSMTGQIEYAFLGVVVTIFGIGVIVYPRRQRNDQPEDEVVKAENEGEAAEHAG